MPCLADEHSLSIYGILHKLLMGGATETTFPEGLAKKPAYLQRSTDMLHLYTIISGAAFMSARFQGLSNSLFEALLMQAELPALCVAWQDLSMMN